MMDRFLVQVNANLGYANIMNNGRYENNVWMNKTRDRDHSEVRSGDELLVYCTSTVPDYGKTLAFSVVVKSVSDDHVSFSLEDPHWFPTRLRFTDIRSLVAEGRLSDTFRSCGAQGFNITKLNPPEAEQILELAEAEPSVGQGEEYSSNATAGSPADRLIEIHLEQWLVDNWELVDFGAPLRLYEEEGEPVGQQYDTGVVGRIDLLCEDTSSNALVVIELKKGRPSDAMIGQLARYMGWVKEHIAHGRPVEGVALVPDFGDRLTYAAKAIPSCRVLRYETRFEIFSQDY